MFETKIVPRVGETDITGHITHTVMPGWFESGRYEIFKLFVPDMDFKKFNLIMAHLEFDFLKEVVPNGDVTIRSRFGKIGRSSCEILQELWQHDQRCVTSRAVLVSFDYETRKSQPIPDEIREKLKPYTGKPSG